MRRQQGLTLLELMVVLLIIGFATAGVALALRDSSQTQLEREAQRLIAVLEQHARNHAPADKLLCGNPPHKAL